jgi:hypothetical protein
LLSNHFKQSDLRARIVVPVHVRALCSDLCPQICHFRDRDSDEVLTPFSLTGQIGSWFRPTLCRLPPKRARPAGATGTRSWSQPQVFITGSAQGIPVP